MSQSNLIKPPTWFWIVAVIALLWNIMGVVAYLGEAFMGAEMMASLPQEQQDLYTSRPAWVTAAFAFAVFGGFLGSLFLLLKKSWATPLFIISLLGVIGQQIHNFFLSNMVEVMGSAAIIFPIIVLIIAIALIFFSRKATSNHWIG